ncbi:MAG: hypothetical protein WCF96_01480 [Eubacteriales bacterium]
MKLFKKNIMKILVATILIIIMAIGTISYLEAKTEVQGHYYPGYDKIDLQTMFQSNEAIPEKISSSQLFSKDTYDLIFAQTGLAKPALEEIISQSKGEKASFITILKAYQESFFTKKPYVCEKVGIITSEEKMTDINGNRTKAFQIASVMTGDIFISKATHSIGFRHGHAAIVVDAENRKTLESILLGYNSTYQSVDKWMGYPSFIQLRLKPGKYMNGKLTDQELGKLVAAFADKYTYDIPYGLLSGLPVKSPSPDKIRKTQCAHLVWYAYENFGIDIDSDGTWLVTPKDIANTDKLEIVQIFGINPNKIWP